MKRFVLLLLAVITVLSLSACGRGSHCTYKEMLAYAQSIDPNATVTEEYQDIVDGNGHEHREWVAVINGIECHVASSERWEEYLPEFWRVCFVPDTDYDYCVLKQLLEEHQPQWSTMDTDAFNRYQWNDILGVNTTYTEKRELSDEELEIAWQQAYEIYAAYSVLPVHKEVNFYVTVPRVFSNLVGDNSHIQYGDLSIRNFSEQGKFDFFNAYHEGWALLESGLPIEE